MTDFVSRKAFLRSMFSGASAFLPARRGGAQAVLAGNAGKNIPMIRHLAREIRLFPVAAAEISGTAEMDGIRRSAKCGGAGRVIWNATALEPGEYEVYLSYAAPRPGLRLTVRSGIHSFSDELGVTDGFARPSEKHHNYERIKLNGRIHLDRGVNPIAIQLASKDQVSKTWIRCLELVPAAAAAEVADSESRVLTERANTDWFVKAGYGVKFTWADTTQPERGRHKSYSEAVSAFNVDAFAGLMEEMGAGYVIFQLNRSQNHCAAPIQTWEEIYPGQTTKRDLIGEIAAAFERKGIRLLLYINSPTLGQLGQIGESGQLHAERSEEVFIDIHRAVLQEIGLRYGRHLTGYWFDSWNRAVQAYPNISFEDLYRLCKIGNPDRLTTFNFFEFPVLTPWQDYWAGELNSLQNPFRERYIKRGPGKGLQAHGMVSMSPEWIHTKPGPITAPQFSAGQLIAYVKANIAHEAVTTINIGVYQEGTTSNEHREMMHQLRRAIRGT